MADRGARVPHAYRAVSVTVCVPEELARSVTSPYCLPSVAVAMAIWEGWLDVKESSCGTGSTLFAARAYPSTCVYVW